MQSLGQSVTAVQRFSVLLNSNYRSFILVITSTPDGKCNVLLIGAGVNHGVAWPSRFVQHRARSRKSEVGIQGLGLLDCPRRGG